MDTKMRELEYLRGELNQTLKFSDEYTHKLFGHIILIWGGTLALFSTKDNFFIGSPFMLFTTATIFFISVIVLYFLSLKNFENKKTICEIAAYIAVFYERRPNIEKDEKIFWELSHFEINKENLKKWAPYENNKELEDENNKKWYEELNNELDKRLNKEYPLFSIIATIIIFIISCILLLGIFCGCFKINVLTILMTFVCFIYAAVSLIFFSRKICKLSSINSEKWLYIKKDYLKSFIIYAIKTGYCSEDDIREKLKEVSEDIIKDLENSGVIKKTES